MQEEKGCSARQVSEKGQCGEGGPEGFQPDREHLLLTYDVSNTPLTLLIVGCLCCTVFLMGGYKFTP